MESRMRYDDMAWEISDNLADSWAIRIRDHSIATEIGMFLIRHYQASDATELNVLTPGAFNIPLKMNFYKTRSAIIRFTLPGATMFPEEKTFIEVATMRFLGDKTTIPVPFVIHSGKKSESPSKLAAFIIMEYIDHFSNMLEIMKAPDRPSNERVTLDPVINPVKLRTLYKGLAKIHFSLSTLSQDRIGSLYQIDDFTWEVAGRPLSLYMNELVRLGTFPRSELPLAATKFDTASSYFSALANLHISHLIYQRNDSVESADDCRRKFVARFLFRKIVQDSHLRDQWLYFENGPFPLWCDDLRPGNVLVDSDLNTAGVVDWEFSYTAPVEFTNAPPWWLLLEKPEYWSKGLDDWSIEYGKRLKVFLEVLKEHEEEMGGDKPKTHRLSTAMQRSWDSGDFWIMYAARDGFAFDGIYWQKIDRRFFGRGRQSNDSGFCDMWKERLDLLQPEEYDLMEKYVDQKLAEMRSGRVLAWDPDENTLEYMAMKG
ncbi:hypothetical protein N7540_005575 [Penicillium herquei]|nr:hypothetical protein N7540_005575 [Penicillium herquei]